jgi:Raf kinase inhibitor-like YbhB/YbcL family protein
MSPWILRTGDQGCPRGYRRTVATRWIAARVGAAVGSTLLAGCGFFGDDVTEPAPTAPATLVVSSPAFADGAPVPARYTCTGEDVSPPLEWSGVPDGARALALVVTDPDAPNGTYVHWVVFNIDPTTRSLPAGEVPPGARQARNSAGHARYDGPCPPSGTHHYRFTVYVLRTPTTLDDGVDTTRALDAIDAKAVGRGTLVGTVSAG